jgi:hypothetical protein
VHWDLAEQVLMQANGIPTVVGLEASPESPESVEAAIADALH